MAEGGVPNTPVGSNTRGSLDDDPSSTTSGSRDLRILDCPICLEQMRQPKSLPCHHSYCQECLSTYITNDLSEKKASATSFPCPVCRKITQPVNQYDKELWAQQFPTNGLIQALTQLKEKADLPLFCRPCEKKGNMTSPAIFWCKSTDGLFCESCKTDFHDMVHDGCDIVNITGPNRMTPWQESFPIRCVQHNEKMDRYCGDHKVLGCINCILDEHRPCEVVTTVLAECQRLEKNSRFKDLEIQLPDGANTMNILMEAVEDQLLSMTEDKDNALQTITDLHQNIDAYLVKVKKDISDDLIKKYKNEKEQIEVTLQKCERLETALQNTYKSLRTFAMDDGSGDNTEKLLLYQRGQTELESCEDLVTEMRNTFTSVRIHHNVNTSLKTLNENTKLGLGSISIQKQPKCLPKGTTPLSKCSVKEIEKIRFNIPADTSETLLTGVVYLPTGHIAVSDNKSNVLKLFTDEGQFLDKMKLPSKPVDMCLVDDNTVGVAVCEHGVLVVKVENSKLVTQSKIQMPNDEQCAGVAYTDGGFIVSTFKKEIYTLTMEGETKRLHQSNTNCFNITHDPKRGHSYASFFTSTAGDAVVCRLIESSNKFTDILKVGVVENALGIDVDREGNVYVCGNSKNVIQMSGNGENVRQLVTPANGIKQLYAISVCGDKFVLTSMKMIHVFHLCEM